MQGDLVIKRTIKLTDILGGMLPLLIYTVTTIYASFNIDMDDVHRMRVGIIWAFTLGLPTLAGYTFSFIINIEKARNYYRLNKNKLIVADCLYLISLATSLICFIIPLMFMANMYYAYIPPVFLFTICIIFMSIYSLAEAEKIPVKSKWLNKALPQKESKRIIVGGVVFLIILCVVCTLIVVLILKNMN